MIVISREYVIIAVKNDFLYLIPYDNYYSEIMTFFITLRFYTINGHLCRRITDCIDTLLYGCRANEITKWFNNLYSNSSTIHYTFDGKNFFNCTDIISYINEKESGSNKYEKLIDCNVTIVLTPKRIITLDMNFKGEEGYLPDNINEFICTTETDYLTHIHNFYDEATDYGDIVEWLIAYGSKKVFLIDTTESMIEEVMLLVEDDTTNLNIQIQIELMKN